MPFSHNALKSTTGIQVFSQVNKYTLSYRFLHGNVQGCVFAKNRPVSLNWTDYYQGLIIDRSLVYKSYPQEMRIKWGVQVDFFTLQL